MYFDGIDDYVRVKYSPVLQPTDKLEIEAGVYADWDELRKRGWTAVVSNTQVGGYALTINSSVFTGNTIGVVFHIGSSYRGVSIPLSELTPGYHVFKGGYDGSKIYFYVDGELKRTLNVTGSITYSLKNALIIGNDAGNGDIPDTGSKYFKGYIDYVKISRGNTILGEWLFEEMNGLIAYDSSGNSFNAELLNGVSWSTFPKGDIFPPSEVRNVEIFSQTQQIDLMFLTPNELDFAGTKIYLNNVLVATLDKTKTSYSFTDLIPNTTYTIKITTFDETGNESEGVTMTARTKTPIVDNVGNLQADAKYDRVKLSWTRPDSEFFSHAKIYRKKVEQKSFWDQLFGTTSVSAETTSDGYTPMFETNGTYWTDLTVTPDTTYSYKVTSVNIEGNESQGVTIETTTPSEPVPVLTGVATTQNENGDYVVTWTSPARGTVKLLIEGREYAQVDAATKQIIVRKEDMKTDFFGAYAATLIPIGDYGTKGQAVNVPSIGGKIDFPLSFQDFLETVVSILAWVAPFLLLSFVFIFWRPIFNFFKKSFAKGGRVKQ
nr:LamG domain-containing protein [Anoxybacillus sp. ST4]